MDYAKFVRKDMPLAVPHQKPPSKYASHPYPIYVIDMVAVIAVMSGVGTTQGIIRDLMQYGGGLAGVGEMRAVLQQLNVDGDTTAYFVATMTGNGELKSILIAISGFDDNINFNQTLMVGSGALNELLIKHQAKYEQVTYSSTMKGLGVMQ